MSRYADNSDDGVRQRSGWLIPLGVFLVTFALSALFLLFYLAPTPPSFFEERAGGDKPPLLEGILDRVRFRCLRALDAAVILIYCFAPLWILRKFRAFKHEREEARAQVKRTVASSPKY